MPDDPRAYLASRIPKETLHRGLEALARLHGSVGRLLGGSAALRVLEHDDQGYAGYYVHERTAALQAIARDGWVERHLCDFVALVRSPVLAECCHARVLGLFGVQAFHVAIQHYPLSDGLVQRLCHEPGDVLERIRRIAGQLVALRAVCGSYPPPGLAPEHVVSVDAPAFDALPIG